MHATRYKTLNLWAVLAVGLLVGVPMLFVPTAALPWVLVAVGGAVAVLLLVHVGQMLALLLVWLAVTSVFGVYYRVLELPGFFNLTIDRLALVGLGLMFFTVFGLYLTIVGLAEYFVKHSFPGGEPWNRLIWPRYILNPELGIHFARVRGPFLNSPDMGLTLVVCFFANLLLATRVGAGWTMVLLLISAPMPVVIYWTLTRSIWLAFVLCLAVAVWFWPRARSVAQAAGMVLTAGLLVAVFLLWPRLASPQRERGGVADLPPVISRYELSLVSLDLARDHPLVGVGLGRFQDAAAASPRMKEFLSRASVYGLGAVEHNNFLSMLAETGFPGAGLYALLVLGLLGVSIRLYRMIPATAVGYLDRRFIAFYWIAWLAFFVDSMFRLTTSSPFPNGMFLLLGGVVVGLYQRLRPGGDGFSQPGHAPTPAGPTADRLDGAGR